MIVIARIDEQRGPAGTHHPSISRIRVTNTLLFAWRGVTPSSSLSLGLKITGFCPPDNSAPRKLCSIIHERRWLSTRSAVLTLYDDVSHSRMHTEYDRRSHRWARRVISGERYRGTPAMDDDRWWIARIKETGDGKPADFPRRKTVPSVVTATGGDRTGYRLSIIRSLS